MEHPCLTCGACCSQYRVAFHWMESDEFTEGGVPHELTEKLDAHRLVMRGTYAPPIQCVALDCKVGEYSRCTIHPNRPSVCRDVDASYEYGKYSEQCAKARAKFGLPELTPADWEWSRVAASNDSNGNPDDNGNDNNPPNAPVAA